MFTFGRRLQLRASLQDLVTGSRFERLGHDAAGLKQFTDTPLFQMKAAVQTPCEPPIRHAHERLCKTTRCLTPRCNAGAYPVL